MILASTSPARRAMLEAAGVPFTVVPPRIDEDAATQALAAGGARPRDLADRLAELKAVQVSTLHPGALVLGADQVLALPDGTRLDKPGTRARLRAQLETLAGRSHRLFAAAVLARAGEPLWRHVGEATLTVRPLSPAFLDLYVQSVPEAVLGSVGGYHIEGLGVQLFTAIAGDLFTVRGLPLLPLLAQLRQLGEMPS
ncbi:Maf family protein [Thermaurantiacus sp.]